jgi:membrane protein YqaA with SNARE-associated domain
MRLFSKLYNLTLRWARHRHAPYYLAAVSFIESSFFPIPPDVMLAPMALANPNRAWRFAAITTLSSVAGALFGYVIGMYFFEWIAPFLTHMGYMADYQKIQGWFQAWGGWILFIAALTPIPFKLFTIAGGALHVALLPFIIGSLVGRALRFYLIAGLMRWGGARMEQWLKKTIDAIGWGMVIILTVGYGIYRWVL